MAEELWERCGGPYSIHSQPWPRHDETLAALESATVVVQVDGKVRERLSVPLGTDEAAIVAEALASERVTRQLAGRSVVRQVYVPDRLLSLVTAPEL
jgi:leucyl-tRNA synthetase